MALSDELTKLAARAKEAETRAKEAETRAAAARAEARADLEQDVSSARASAEEQAEKLRQGAEEGKERISSFGKDLQKSWNEQVARIREDMDSKKAKHDVHMAQGRAEDAEAYASYTIDFAYSAVVEAEYAALDAALARMDADQLAKEAGTTA